MDRTQKADLVDVLHETFTGAGVVVVTQQSGLTVAETEDLRRQMREVGARYKVTKNRLARRALQGTQYEALVEQFTGPTAIATSEDPVAAAKVAVKFADGNDKLTVIGGALGDKMLDAAAVKALASLPSLDELRGKIVGLVNSPATKIAGVLQAPAGQLARVISAHASQSE
ncbi:MAG: 50S ribosomal protein L10 [Rhodospirillaceae bacterium]